MITIDGSHGEGGGQMLRTALSLSSILGRPFRIVNIRKNRRKPGLMPQHLAAVSAAQTVTAAQVEGARNGSMELIYQPGATSGGSFRFDIGTAGSTTLVLQTVIPILLFADRDSSLTVTGGTNVPFSPSADYLADVFAPMLHRLGCHITLHRDRCGFYPRGGGSIRAEVARSAGLVPISLHERGALRLVTGCSAVGNLPDSIAERQRRKVVELLRPLPCPVEIDTVHVNVYGPGAFVFLRLDTDQALAGFEALGAPGKPAEVVAAEAAHALLAHTGTNAAIDSHLADQIALYLGLCRSKSVFTTSVVTKHLLTNLWVMEQFDLCHYSVTGDEGNAGRVVIN